MQRTALIVEGRLSMISNKDRIEAARFLRSCNCDGESFAKCCEISEALFGNKYAICDLNVPCGKLADLIDRKTCAIVESYMGDNLESVEETPRHVLSCGHIAYGEDDPMFCPVCGAAVTDDYR